MLFLNRDARLTLIVCWLFIYTKFNALLTTSHFYKEYFLDILDYEYRNSAKNTPFNQLHIVFCISQLKNFSLNQASFILHLTIDALAFG